MTGYWNLGLKKLFMKFLVFVFSLCFLVVLSAEAKKRPKRYNAVVQLTDNKSYKGIIEKVSNDGITIDYFGSSKFISSNTIKSIKVKKTGTLTKSILVGGVAGLAVGYGIYAKAEGDGTIQSQAFPVVVVGMGLVGGGIVALINSFISKKHYHNLEIPGEYKKIVTVLSTYSSEKLPQ